ncbi:MAG: orotidine-5'-phosphate decarboxylase [Alphaproteobacteria bacterium]|nr:orotidine-5'-phosphate decarboxylase [Alphaproteobacteria bacterium]MDP6517176.1 orotidine-5'-phosphate decarboxylase [Alphaproteobacteria bacterium]
MTEENRARQIICAIDTSDRDEAVALAGALSGQVGAIKLGLEFFAACGPAGVREVADGGAPIFLDLKLHDIPNTVAGAVRAAGACHPFMITIHAAGGAAMMRAAAAASMRAAPDSGASRPLLVGVTVLTSFDRDDLGATGVGGALDDQVRRLAALVQDCGLDGVVCSAHEIAILRRQCGADFKLVVPGIRPGWSSADDQKRIVTPADAVRQGADYLVIGRPITRSDDPAAAAGRIAAEMAAAHA